MAGGVSVWEESHRSILVLDFVLGILRFPFFRSRAIGVHLNKSLDDMSIEDSTKIIQSFNEEWPLQILIFARAKPF